MNNSNLDQYSSDPDVSFGVKGKKDIWIGYKRHVGMESIVSNLKRLIVIGAEPITISQPPTEEESRPKIRFLKVNLK